MKFHAVLFASLIALLSVFSACFAHQNPGASEAAIKSAEIQKPADSAATSNSSDIPKPSEPEAASDSPEIQKPSEAEALEAAIRYVNREGRLTIKESKFIAWGTFSEEQVYWPMKFRLAYTSAGSDTLRQNEYAVKISKDINGKWIAAQYYAWRTDFKR